VAAVILWEDETREEGLCMGDRLHMPCALSLLSCERVRNE